MSEADKIQVIAKLHMAYKQLTGLVVPLDSFREYQWFEWLRRGLEEEDLRLVVKFIRRSIERGERGFNYGSLRFNRLIGQVDIFEELLAEATTDRGNRRIDPNYASVLAATGRSAEDKGREPRRAGEVAQRVTSDPDKAAAALEELRKLKGSL